MKERIVRRLQGAAILLAIGMFVVAIGTALYQPVEAARQALTDARARTARFEAKLAEDQAVQKVDTAQVIDQEGPAAAAIKVQRVIVDLAQASGMAMQQLTPMPVKELERGISQHSFGLQLTGDLEQGAALLRELSKQRPVIFVDNLVMQTGAAHRGDLAMNVQIQLTAYAIGGAVPK